MLPSEMRFREEVNMSTNTNDCYDLTVTPRIAYLMEELRDEPVS